MGKEIYYNINRPEIPVEKIYENLQYEMVELEKKKILVNINNPEDKILMRKVFYFQQINSLGLRTGYEREGRHFTPLLYWKHEKPKGINIGNWGQVRLNYLKEYRTEVYEQMIDEGTLWSYLIDFNSQIVQLRERETERLRAKIQKKLGRPLQLDSLEVVQEIEQMNNQIQEIVNQLLYS